MRDGDKSRCGTSHILRLPLRAAPPCSPCHSATGVRRPELTASPSGQVPRQGLHQGGRPHQQGAPGDRRHVLPRPKGDRRQGERPLTLARRSRSPDTTRSHTDRTSAVLALRVFPSRPAYIRYHSPRLRFADVRDGHRHRRRRLPQQVVVRRQRNPRHLDGGRQGAQPPRPNSPLAPTHRTRPCRPSRRAQSARASPCTSTLPSSRATTSSCCRCRASTSSTAARTPATSSPSRHRHRHRHLPTPPAPPPPPPHLAVALATFADLTTSIALSLSPSPRSRHAPPHTASRPPPSARPSPKIRSLATGALPCLPDTMESSSEPSSAPSLHLLCTFPAGVLHHPGRRLLLQGGDADRLRVLPRAQGHHQEEVWRRRDLGRRRGRLRAPL